MKLVGTKGRVELDFVDDEFSIFNTRGKLVKKEKLLGKHVETFLEMLLSGKGQPLSLPGVVSFDVALEILKLLEAAKSQVTAMPEYPCGESLEKILERF